MDKLIERNIIECLVNYFNNLDRDSQNLSVNPNPMTEAQGMNLAVYLKKFIDEIPGGFFIYQADGEEKIIYANEAVLRIFNCDTMEEFRELTGNSFRGLVHPDDLEAVERSIWEQIANSQYDLDYVEYRIIPKGGGIRWIDDYGHFVHSESSGDIFYVFVGDATEKKERQLKERQMLISEKHKTEQQLQSQIKEYDEELQMIHREDLRHYEIIEGLSIDYESVFYVHLDTNQMKAYRIGEHFQKQFPTLHQICEFTGFDTDYIKEFVHPDDREIVAGVSNPEYIRNRLAENKSFHINYRILRNGKTIYKQLRMVRVGNEERISHVIMGYRNVDAEVIQEMKQKQMMAKALEEAKLANNAKNLFLSNMSHDIRTPMNAIVGFTSLAQTYKDEEKISECLDMISTASEQLMQILNDILEISRIESGKLWVEEETCNLLVLFEQMQADMLVHASEKNISLSLDMSSLKHPIVCADCQKLRQILSYLVDNAVKYTKEDGTITILVSEQENKGNGYVSYRFIVEDNGIGMSSEFQEHLFDAFEREKNTTLSGIHGTGLGLTITKNLVEMLGGKIEVDSVVGKGSRFIVTLPLRTERQTAAKQSDMDDIHNQKQDKNSIDDSPSQRILIVDDNEINLEIENEVLKSAGFLVDVAMDGCYALEKVKQAEPGYYDLILMDIQMPIMDGYHATKAIRELDDKRKANIPIIAVSANTFEEDRKKAIESGMNVHLAKPIDVASLYDMIRKYI